MAKFIKNAGLPSMLKEGSSVQDDPLLKNIEACKEMAKVTKSSYGPYGLNKMVINHLGKLFVTHDAAVILRELEVQHPAANLLVMASKAMEEEVGDGSNYTIMLAAELLSQAESLKKTGLKPAEIIRGYTVASKKALETLKTCIVGKVTDHRDEEQVVAAITSSIASKQYGNEGFLTPLIAKACINAAHKNPKNFSVDNVRILKIRGGSLSDSFMVRGFCILRGTEGTIKEAKDAKVAVYNCAIDAAATETKGNVLLENAEELLNFSKSEEERLEKAIKAVADAGVKVIVSNSNYSDMALHFVERFGMMAIKVASKFEMKRLCLAVGAKQIVKLEPPTAEDMGHCDEVRVRELGSSRVLSFCQNSDDSKLSTIIVRGATEQALDDIERAIDDGINTYKILGRDPSLLAGAGANDIELYNALQTYADETPGIDQYSIRCFANAFEIGPRTLAEVAGHNANEVTPALIAAHTEGDKEAGIDIESGAVQTTPVRDAYLTRFWSIQLATEAVMNVLRVDQIIMAKPAGGPKPRAGGARDDDE
eukprot:TRINITY_DN47830_c0_g1_i1.p1 TRINITY_DN47830_c0_g1~~TRINITY_DN47830_c0_g1_i1.p1  ORF type:complete len:538 (+),score=168.83 TRINITY_DN47830_c0_g1_i1:41-1654(+)